MSQAEATDKPIPPWYGGQTITAAQLEEVRLKGSREDCKRLVAALVEFGSVTVVPDEEPA